MNTTQLLLEAIRKRDRLTTDTEVAKALRLRGVRVSQQQLSNYLRGERQANDDVAMRLSGIVMADYAVVLARIRAERAEPGIAKLGWQATVRRLEAEMTLEAHLKTLKPAQLPYFASKAA